MFEKSSAVRSPVATSAIRHAAAMGRLAQDFFLPFFGIDTRCEHQNSKHRHESHRTGHESHSDIPVRSAKRPSRCGSFPCLQRFIVRLASRASCLRFGPLCHAAMLASAKALRERPSQEQRRFARRRRGAVPVPSSQRNCMILASACILSHTHSRALRAACMHVSASARCMHANASARALRYAPCMHMRLAGA